MTEPQDPTDPGQDEQTPGDTVQDLVTGDDDPWTSLDMGTFEAREGESWESRDMGSASFSKGWTPLVESDEGGEGE